MKLKLVVDEEIVLSEMQPLLYFNIVEGTSSSFEFALLSYFWEYILGDSNETKD